MDRRKFLTTGSLGFAGAVLPPGVPSALIQTPAAVALARPSDPPPDFLLPKFELVQPELFSLSGAQTNCWADFDGDRNLDLFVGF